MNFRQPNKPASFAVATASARAQLFGSSNPTSAVSNVTMRNTKKDANGGQSISEQTRMMLEEQNNRDIAALSEKVSFMKNLATDIEAAIQEDHTILNNTSSTFDRVTGMMRGTIGNVNKMLSTGGSKHMCYLVMFIVCLFLSLYWLMK